MTRTRTGVYASHAREGIALMDIRRGKGRWRSLDPVGAELWLTVTGGTAPGHAVDQLTTRWQTAGADPDQVRADLTALLTALHDADLLTPAAPPVCAEPGGGPVVRVAVPGPVGAVQQVAGLAGLLVGLVLVRCLPIRLTLTAAHAVTRLPGRPATVEQADAAFAAVRRAARWWPGRAACLEESLATHLAAALTGHRVRWVIGARFTDRAALLRMAALQIAGGIRTPAGHAGGPQPDAAPDPRLRRRCRVPRRQVAAERGRPCRVPPGGRYLRTP